MFKELMRKTEETREQREKKERDIEVIKMAIEKMFPEDMKKTIEDNDAYGRIMVRVAMDRRGRLDRADYYFEAKVRTDGQVEWILGGEKVNEATLLYVYNEYVHQIETGTIFFK